MKKSNKETAAYFIEKVIKLQEDAMLIGESRNKQIQNIKVNKFIEDLAFLGSIAPTSRKVNITGAEYRKMFTDLIIEANKLIQ